MPTVGLAVLNGGSLALTGSLAVVRTANAGPRQPDCKAHTEDQRGIVIQGIVIQGIVIQGNVIQGIVIQGIVIQGSS